MNGANAVPSVNTISAPNRTETSNIGINQNFLLAIINLINSFKKLINFN